MSVVPIAAVGPCCFRCGQLVWRSPDARLIDSRGRTTCPAPWWARPLVANVHSVEPVSVFADLGLAAVRAALAGTALFVAAVLVATVLAVWI